MSNNGFSAAVSFWGAISGLAAKTSSDGRTSSLAKAMDSHGDTVASDQYGDVLAPSTEYAVVGVVDLSNIVLGSIHTVTVDGQARKVMLSTVAIRTQAGNQPTIAISGVEVEAGAVALRTYALTGTLKPRSKAQDVCGAFTASNNFTQIDTTCTINVATATVKGAPVASDCSGGSIEVVATMTDPTGNGEITANASGGFVVSTTPAASDPDADYRTDSA